ncbi:MAG: metal ABC transporter ATP-binding protein [Dehalococcoidia bacterium]|nr:metal ABC transporter ATP-binding protein [Dehalococcoidia bacterium]MSQ17292.1 metal ABC transporter ATP-binding protein [Dehalococcoidia bacterium]
MLDTAKLTGGHAIPTPDDGSPPVLEVRGLWAGYDHTPALQEINFQVAQGDIVGVIGPNGSGKSTLLKAILGLMPPWRGEVLLLGHAAASQQRRIGYMPQMERVDWDFPVTVDDVALMGRYARRGLLRRTTREDREAASAALDRVGMLPLRHRLIGELSGGQRRRALLARALANNPVLLLLDEPMAGLDATAQHQLLDIIADLQASGTTIVLCTHDLSCVSSCCVKALCLNRRQVAFGPPDAVLNETVLNETFGTHLLLVHGDGNAYAYGHHTHPDADHPHQTAASDGTEPSPRRK